MDDDGAVTDPATDPATAADPFEGGATVRTATAADERALRELDGAVVGYARLAPATPLPESRHVLAVNGLAVLPAVRGRGVARSLLTAVERRAREGGVTKLSLRVFATNGPARRLYERAGLVVEGGCAGSSASRGPTSTTW